MHELRKCSLGLQSYSGGLFVPPLLSSAVGNIWPSYCFALPTQCCERITAVSVSGHDLAQKGNGDRERDKGSLHRQSRAGTPAPPVAPHLQVCRTSEGEAPQATGVRTSHIDPEAAERRQRKRVRAERAKALGPFVSTWRKPEIVTATAVAIAVQVLSGRRGMIQLLCSQILASSWFLIATCSIQR